LLAKSSLNIKDGGGCYLFLTTRPFEKGLTVNEDTMRVYLKRYGVPDDHIRSIFKREPIVIYFYRKKTSKTRLVFPVNGIQSDHIFRK